MPNHSGNNGHGGVHVCHKCGWPFPNHHPSSRHRRSHKRVCGTIEGYRLDNCAQDKTYNEGDVGEPNSDDELKTTSENVVESTISRKSSSGVGSKSSGPIRSEEDVYTDAVTELNESSATLTREASDGVTQRYYSLENGNEMDDTEGAEESHGGTDNLCTPDHLKDNKLQTVQRVEGENEKSKAGIGPQDYLSTSPLVSAAVALESENAVDQNMIQSSEQPGKLDIVSERGKEFISGKDESDLRTSYSSPEEVTEVIVLKVVSDEVKGVSVEVLDSVSADGLMNATMMETDGVVDNNERFNDVDFPEKVKTEGCNEVNSPGNICAPVLKIQHIDSGNSNVTKSDLIGERDVLSVADVFSLLQHPEIAVGDLDHKGGQSNFSEATDSTDESVQYIKACAVNMGSSHIDFTKTGDNDRVFCEDICSMMDKWEDSKKSIDVQNTFREPDQMSDADSSTVEVNILRNEVVKDLKSKYSEKEKDEKKHIFPEGVTLDAGHMQTTMIESTGENARKIHYIDGNGTAVNLITDDHLNSTSKLEVYEDIESSCQSSAVVNHCSNEKFTEKSPCINEGNGVIKHHVTIPAIDTIVDSGSQTGSLDGNWGSVSVISTSSDAQPTADTIASNHPRALEGEESLSMVPQNQTAVTTEVGIPTVTLVANETDRGNKDKETMAKVTKLDSGKQHTPLKTLLGEAIAKSRAESPVHHNQTENVILNSDHLGTEMEAAQEESGKEWNSPARYAVKIKTEKRRSKNRSYWAPFLCCSSANAR